MSNSRVSTWSGIRNKLENDYLCPALRGHIQYFSTSYSKSADHEGRAAIRMDSVEVLRSNYYIYFENVWTKFHHLRSTTLKDCEKCSRSFLTHGCGRKPGLFPGLLMQENQNNKNAGRWQGLVGIALLAVAVFLAFGLSHWYADTQRLKN